MGKLSPEKAQELADALNRENEELTKKNGDPEVVTPEEISSNIRLKTSWLWGEANGYKK